MSGGVCRVSCAMTTECLANEVCENAVCVVRGDNDGGANVLDASEDDASGFADATVRPDALPVPDLGVQECTTNEECGEPTFGDYGPCEVFEDTCDESGEKKRQALKPVCSDRGLCTIENREETAACTRDTENEVCAPDQMSPPSECIALSECEEMGTQAVNITAFRCRQAACVPLQRAKVQGCMRQTEGHTCGKGETIEAGECVYSSECGLDGEQTLLVTRFRCAQNVCEPETTTQTPVPCSRPSSDGAECSGPGNESQCCGEQCIAKDDDANCGVCGMSCGLRNCETHQTVNNQTVYACSCELAVGCINNYGLNSSCVPGDDICSCSCGAQASPCAGECTVGQCYMAGNFGYCGY